MAEYFTQSFRLHNRNRFVVGVSEKGWGVYRLGQKGSVNLLWQMHDRDAAAGLVVQLNGLYERRMII